MATIQGIYVALFGRPADPLGLNYFNEATGNGANLDAIGDLASTDEYQDRFDGLTNNEIITQIYQDLFGRDPEAAGLEFFVAALNNGTLNINNIAIAILDGAQGDDAAVVANKVAAADAFTAALDTEIEKGAYKGDKAAEIARNLLSGITADKKSIPDADEIAAQVKAVVDAVSEGKTFELEVNTAPDINEITGDGKNNIFDAVTNAGSWASGDKLDGGLGVDTLNASLAANVAPAKGAVKNIEIFNITATDEVEVDFTNIAGAQQVWNVKSTDVLDIIGLAAGVELGLKGAITGAASFALADADGDKDAVTLTLSEATAGTVTIADVETINLVVAGASTAELVVTDADVVVTGKGNLTLTGDYASVDASALDGVLKIEVDARALATDAGTVITGTDNADTITLALGEDVIVYNTTEKSNYSKLEKITDFDAAADAIDLSAFNLEEGLTALDNLFDGADFAGNAVAWYDDGTNTYVFVDTNGNGTVDFNGDLAVQLVGNVALEAANFIFAAA
jgi:hypothetical protein